MRETMNDDSSPQVRTERSRIRRNWMRLSTARPKKPSRSPRTNQPDSTSPRASPPAAMAASYTLASGSGSMLRDERFPLDDAGEKVRPVRDEPVHAKVHHAPHLVRLVDGVDPDVHARLAAAPDPLLGERPDLEQHHAAAERERAPDRIAKARLPRKAEGCGPIQGTKRLEDLHVEGRDERSVLEARRLHPPPDRPGSHLGRRRAPL